MRPDLCPQLYGLTSLAGSGVQVMDDEPSASGPVSRRQSFIAYQPLESRRSGSVMLSTAAAVSSSAGHHTAASSFSSSASFRSSAAGIIAIPTTIDSGLQSAPPTHVRDNVPLVESRFGSLRQHDAPRSSRDFHYVVVGSTASAHIRSVQQHRVVPGGRVAAGASMISVASVRSHAPSSLQVPGADVPVPTVTTSEEVPALLSEQFHAVYAQHRTSFLHISIRPQSVTIFLYNWTPSARERFSSAFLRLASWHHIRSHTLSHILHQKMGLFAHCSASAPPLELSTTLATTEPSGSQGQSTNVAASGSGSGLSSSGGSATSVIPGSNARLTLENVEILMSSTMPTRRAADTVLNSSSSGSMSTSSPSTTAASPSSGTNNSGASSGGSQPTGSVTPGFRPAHLQRRSGPGGQAPTAASSTTSTPSSDDAEQRQRRRLAAMASFELVLKSIVPTHPMHLTNVSTVSDPLTRHGFQFLEMSAALNRQLQRHTRMRELYQRWIRRERSGPPSSSSSGAGPSSQSAQASAEDQRKALASNVRIIKRASRLVHFCRKPLLFSSRRKTLIQDDGRPLAPTGPSALSTAPPTSSLPTAQSGPTGSTPVARQRSADGVFEGKSGASAQQALSVSSFASNELAALAATEADQRWYLEMLARFIKQYVSYLESLGFSLIGVVDNASSGDATSYASPVQHAHSQSPAASSPAGSSPAAAAAAAAAAASPSASNSSSSSSLVIGLSSRRQTSRSAQPPVTATNPPLSSGSSSGSTSQVRTSSELLSAAVAQNPLALLTSSTFLQKVYSGGMVLVKVSFRDVFVCINMYATEGSRMRAIQQPFAPMTSTFSDSMQQAMYASQTSSQQANKLASSSSSTSAYVVSLSGKAAVEQSRKFTEECARLKDYLHINSFTYDFHLRYFQQFIVDSTLRYPSLHLLDLLQDFMALNMPSTFARNRIYKGAVALDPNISSPDEFFAFISRRASHYGFYSLDELSLIADMNGAVPSSSSSSSSPDAIFLLSRRPDLGLGELQSQALTPGGRPSAADSRRPTGAIEFSSQGDYDYLLLVFPEDGRLAATAPAELRLSTVANRVTPRALDVSPITGSFTDVDARSFTLNYVLLATNVRTTFPILNWQAAQASAPSTAAAAAVLGALLNRSTAGAADDRAPAVCTIRRDTAWEALRQGTEKPNKAGLTATEFMRLMQLSQREDFALTDPTVASVLCMPVPWEKVLSSVVARFGKDVRDILTDTSISPPVPASSVNLSLVPVTPMPESTRTAEGMLSSSVAAAAQLAVPPQRRMSSSGPSGGAGSSSGGFFASLGFGRKTPVVPIPTATTATVEVATGLTSPLATSVTSAGLASPLAPPSSVMSNTMGLSGSYVTTSYAPGSTSGAVTLSSNPVPGSGTSVRHVVLLNPAFADVLLHLQHDRVARKFSITFVHREEPVSDDARASELQHAASVVNVISTLMWTLMLND
ncbi:hypothetical protein CAOG_08521 [Capsaspora owczarzaki ATCC 30864]|uniref:hypothetical protein n=1 Tax=Capsaspora owczarzaki (strain ATCC 30864) TaxID=595528 RepID=UPI0003521023|nr:hypothetical protein CAOG_08521 [Capsaspora owczarzaki ATCC 30864]|eukprot:XP_011270102.1 hypothetical protein CAOG_08521 [Capsaspora owczarzaki ATCC 30864]